MTTGDARCCARNVSLACGLTDRRVGHESRTQPSRRTGSPHARRPEGVSLHLPLPLSSDGGLRTGRPMRGLSRNSRRANAKRSRGGERKAVQLARKRRAAEATDSMITKTNPNEPEQATCAPAAGSAPWEGNPPRVEHLSWDSAERAALLNDYWQRERLDYLKIHLQGSWGIAHARGREYPHHVAEAKRCQAIYDARTQSSASMAGRRRPIPMEA